MPYANSPTWDYFDKAAGLSRKEMLGIRISLGYEVYFSRCNFLETGIGYNLTDLHSNRKNYLGNICTSSQGSLKIWDLKLGYKRLLLNGNLKPYISGGITARCSRVNYKIKQTYPFGSYIEESYNRQHYSMGLYTKIGADKQINRIKISIALETIFFSYLELSNINKDDKFDLGSLNLVLGLSYKL